jgi:hypothetical protein
MVLREAVRDRGGPPAPNVPALRGAVLTAESDRRRVVVELIETKRPTLADRDHHIRQQGRTIGIEEPVQRATELVVADSVRLFSDETIHRRRKGAHRFLLPIDGLTLHDDRAQEHPEGFGVRESDPPVLSRDMLLEDLLESHPLQKSIHQRQRAEAFGAEFEMAPLRRSQSCASISDR